MIASGSSVTVATRAMPKNRFAMELGIFISQSPRTATVPTRKKLRYCGKSKREGNPSTYRLIGSMILIRKLTVARSRTKAAIFR